MTALSAQPKIGTRLMALTSTMRQVLSNHRKYVAPFWHMTTARLIPRRFRILVLGKVHSRNAQLNSGQIENNL